MIVGCVLALAGTRDARSVPYMRLDGVVSPAGYPLEVAQSREDLAALGLTDIADQVDLDKELLLVVRAGHTPRCTVGVADLQRMRDDAVVRVQVAQDCPAMDADVLVLAAELLRVPLDGLPSCRGRFVLPDRPGLVGETADATWDSC